MELLFSNGWTQLWVLIATSILCIAMSFWLGAHHFRLHKRVSIAAPTTITNIGNTQPRLPTLHITDIVQHGRIVEIKGATNAGTVVMINGQPVASIFPENTFRHFLGPLPRGTSVVSITCQDEQGGVSHSEFRYDIGFTRMA